MMKKMLGAICPAATLGGTMLVGAQSASAATAEVGLFSDSNYGGCAYYVYGTTNIPHFGSLVYTSPASCKTKSLADSVSSVSNLDCTIRLYVDGNYSGSWVQIPPHTAVAQVVDNDEFSSLKFFC